MAAECRQLGAQTLLWQADLARAAYPEEIVDAVAYLLSDDASYTGGADIRITGG